MGKQLQRQDSCVESNRAGCMWNLMHMLNYHHWHSVKNRKRAGGRQLRCKGSYGSRKATINNLDTGKRQEFAAAEAEPSLVKQQSTEARSAKKRSGKSRIKTPKQENPKSRILSFHVQSWLWRTSVVHDVEPSETCFEETRKHAEEREEEVVEFSPKEKLMRTNQLNKDIASELEILEIFKENKDLFLKLLQEPDFSGLKNSNSKVILTKSRSFPVADSSGATKTKFRSTLKHKQKEIWSFRKGEKLFGNDNDSAGNVTKQEKSFSSLAEGLSHQGWNQLVINRFKDITQKLMQAIQESKKEDLHPSIKALFHKDPSERDGRELSETPGQQRDKVDGSLDDSLDKPRPRRVRRTSSLDESLSRYTQLFESSYSSDHQSKWNRSRSLKLKSEDKVPLTGNARKTNRRNLSLSDLDSLCSIYNGGPKDAFRLGMPVKNDEEKKEHLEAILETEFEKKIGEISDKSENVADRESRNHLEQEIGFTMNPESQLAQPVESSILEPCSSDNITRNAEFSILEGSKTNRRSSQVNESDSLEIRCNIDSSPASSSNADSEIQDKIIEAHSLRFVDKEDDPDSEFNYVRHVLELSGFIDHGCLGAWHSIDQPLDPTLFKELEACYEPESYERHVTSDYWDHQLLFDLVNETLLDIYERSHTYFPRALSFGGGIRPMLKGQHLVDDVWTRISSYLSLRPEMDLSLDDVVARDLAKDDRWMKLQWETECVALELEDLIFDELLDEVMPCV